MLHIHILGPLQATLNGRTLDLGSARQRAVIARLVAAGGHVISTDRFIDDLWQGQPPPKALAALQVYVSNLRRVLEPERPPRAPARVIVSAPPGYRLSLPDEAVDAWRLPGLIDAAGAALKQGAGATAHDLLDQALELWKGPAYGEFTESWTAPEISRLNELRLIALEYRAEAALLLGRHAEAVPELRRHANAHPLRENAVRLLALAHYRAGSQAEALAVLRNARRKLADELGVDPGPALRALEQDILRQSESLHAPAVVERVPVRPSVPDEPAIVGRARELAILREEAAHGAYRIVWLGGEPGAGKTTLAETFAAELAERGWRVAFGRCPEIDGDAPPAWAWSEIVRRLAGARPPEDESRLAPLLRDGVPIQNQFQLARAVADYLTAQTPLLVVLEDVHRADGETLHLLRHLKSPGKDPGGTSGSTAGNRAGGRPKILVVATHRPAETTDDLAATLAALATDGRHLELGGLAEDEVAALLERHSERDLDPATIRTVAERTLGNPLFVCEIARLVAGEGPAAARALPPGVRDLIRRRIGRLPATAQTVLRNAAIVGRDADVDVLIALHDGDEETVFDGLEAGVMTGLLTEPGPGRVRFTHVLVRQVLYEDTARIRRTRLHGRVVTALERLRPGDVAALAHHALEAAAPSAVGYARAAARQASDLYAHRQAAALWKAALEFAADDATRLDLMCGLVSALGHAGDVIGALETRSQAVRLALTMAGSRTADGLPANDGSSPDGALARALTSYDAPVTWTIQQDSRYDEAFVAAVERELAAGHDAETRCRLLAALVFALEGHDDDRVDAAGAEAVALARSLNRPDLLCLALNARYFALLAPSRRGELAALGAELLELGGTHRYVGYLTLAHFALLMVELGRNDLAAAQRHADLGVEMSTSGQLGLALGVMTLFGALRKLVEGDFDVAEGTYTALTQQMSERGVVNAAAMGALGRFVVRLARGDVHRSVDELATLHARVDNAGTRDLYAAALAAVGDLEAARRVWRPEFTHARDYYWLLWEQLRGQTAVALGDLEAAARCYRNLLPWEGELGGLSSGSVTLGPVALALGDLAGLLGLESRGHYENAVRVAELVGSPHWARAAKERA
ncbi:AAA family ATPase [Nonomuraea sp. NN258]|uniref:BTAD domain-containing putative transcriptional regulator n=1 Tax=Nonomuraea antri TaxID=2730852 RepID=UPI00156A3571|nr:BTAD domain-containing putative transcriptional regulator [Nonomuraea antri]NRQ34616.1 AAA family ATPase [Nonomuraea antri]